MKRTKQAKIISLTPKIKDKKEEVLIWTKDVFAHLNDKLEEHFENSLTNKKSTT